MPVLTEGPEKRYALALFELAQQEKALSDVSTAAAALSQFLQQEKSAKEYLASRTVSAEDKTRAMVDVLTVLEAPKLFNTFIRFVGQENRLNILPGILFQLDRLFAKAQGKIVVKVATATKLTDAQRTELQAIALKLSAGAKTVELEETVDKKLLGGVRLQIGSHAWDATLHNQLEELKKQLS